MTDDSLSPAARLTGLAERLRDRSPALAGCLFGGAVAAGLGLGAYAVVVMALWIGSPYPDSGPGGATGTAVSLWLLGHGVGLTRADTLTGAPAPLGLIPLLLAVVPFWLVRRAAREAAEPETSEAPEIPGRTVVCGITGGYTAVGALAALYATGGELRPSLREAAWHLPLLALAAALAGLRSVRGRSAGTPSPARPEGWAGRVRAALAGRRCATACRAGLAAALALAGGGAVLVGASLTLHWEPARASYLLLTDVWSGRFAVLLLALALLPNAVIWGAAYALGTGFQVGTGTLVTPLAATLGPALPPFPLLAAVPPEGPGTPLTWVSAAIPVVAGLTAGWFTARAAVPDAAPVREAATPPWSAAATAGVAALAALVAGLVCAVAARAAGGPLGTGRLAELGPVWWAAGGAALGWTLLLGVPTALALRAWRLRAREPRGAAARGGRWAGAGLFGIAMTGTGLAVPGAGAPDGGAAPDGGRGRADEPEAREPDDDPERVDPLDWWERVSRPDPVAALGGSSGAPCDLYDQLPAHGAEEWRALPLEPRDPPGEEPPERR
ncbi:cell division protein PerM [Streptomyces sp. BBFR102]|uniref:cell division protein PerM n=1 Tax=Streptomyces sp. BBFR102 TaxID=3448171 RepID=UPI003F52CDF4